MNLRILKPGHKVKLRDGTVARVLTETGDGNSIRVEYLELGGASSPVGAEAMVEEREIEALLGVAHPRTWGRRRRRSCTTCQRTKTLSPASRPSR